MTDHEKPAERGLDGLPDFVRLAAEHRDDSPKTPEGQRRDGFPYEPGWRPGSAETSRAAALSIRSAAPTMLAAVTELLTECPASPEQLQAKLAARGTKALLTSVRARVCQLHKQGRVVDTGERGMGESGTAKVVIWRLATPEEFSLFLARRAAEAEHGERPHG
jgi:hypothetical protein